MPRFKVILVHPLYTGNIGSVARVMKNFGFTDLAMVRPPEMDEDARKMAMHAWDLVEGAGVHDTLEGALEGVDLVVGTTGHVTENDKKFLRTNVSPEELCGRLAESDGTIGLLFGREDVGLLNEELAKCDMVVTIPAHYEYSVLNLSHAAAVVLYTLYRSLGADVPSRKLAGGEQEHLHDFFSRLLEATDYPEHKREKTEIMFRRLMGRAVLTKWEYHTFMGVLDRALYTIGSGPVEKEK